MFNSKQTNLFNFTEQTSESTGRKRSVHPFMHRN